MYESYADMGLNEWIKIRIVVKGKKASLFLNDNKEPSLIVNDLKNGENNSGAIGLFVDQGTEGYFSDLKIHKNYTDLLEWQSELQGAIVVKRAYLDGIADPDQMTYREMRRTSNDIFSKIIEAQATLRETTLLEAKIKRLTTCRAVYDKLTLFLEAVITQVKEQETLNAVAGGTPQGE